MEALFTPAIVDKIVGLWGPFALMALGGWYALKWLAKRDDMRNEAMVGIIKEFTAVVANNTTAMQASAASGDRLTAEFKNLEGRVEILISQGRQPARRPLKRAA